MGHVHFRKIWANFRRAHSENMIRCVPAPREGTRGISTAEPRIQFPRAPPSSLVPTTLACVQIYLALRSLQNGEVFLFSAQFVLEYFLIPHKTMRFLGTRRVLCFSFVLFPGLQSGESMVDVG